MTGDTAKVNRMVTFALRWFPHGGGPAEEIIAVFGMDTGEFFRCLHAQLHPNPPDSASADDRGEDEGSGTAASVARGLRSTARGTLGRAPVAYRQLALVGTLCVGQARLREFSTGLPQIICGNAGAPLAGRQ